MILEMKKHGYSEKTIIATVRRLRHLDRYVDLNDTEKVIQHIMGKPVSRNYKISILYAYQRYLDANNINYKVPKLKMA